MDLTELGIENMRFEPFLKIQNLTKPMRRKRRGTGR